MLMTAAETAPEYLSLRQTERGSSLGLSPTDYRLLAATGLSIIRPFENSLMGIYQPQPRIVALDIWIQDVCLTVVIDKDHGQLRLFSAEIDSPSAPLLLFAGDTSRQQLKETALGQR
jgi:hypothetical protein